MAELIDAIWEDEPPRSARASLQALMTRLRQLLKPVPGASLTRCGDGYLLELDQDLVDAERSLFAGTFADASVLWGFVAALVTAAIGLWVGVRSIRKATV